MYSIYTYSVEYEGEDNLLWCVGRPVNAVVSASFKSFPVGVMNICTIVHVDGDKYLCCVPLSSPILPHPPLIYALTFVI